jgi:TPR repeat protein
MKPTLAIVCIALLCGCEDNAPHDAQKMALDELLAAAPTGTAEQQFQLGMRYLRGEDVSTNAFNAAIWFRRAAMHGHSEAMFRLAECYDASELPESAEETMYWLRKAADSGHPRAMAFLGGKLCVSDTTKNVQEGRSWLEKSAQNGCVDGMRALARQLIEQDKPDEARVLYRAAALKGDARSAVFFGLSLANAEPNSGQFIESLAWMQVGIAGDEAIPERLMEMVEELDEKSAERLNERVKEIRMLIRQQAG